MMICVVEMSHWLKYYYPFRALGLLPEAEAEVLSCFFITCQMDHLVHHAGTPIHSLGCRGVSDDMAGKIVCLVASSLGVLKTLMSYTDIQDDSILKYMNLERV